MKNSQKPRELQLLARYISASGDSYTWSTTPTDEYTKMTNAQLEIAALLRLLLPFVTPQDPTNQHSYLELTCSTCNQTSVPIDDNNPVGSVNDIDEYGAHAVRCGRFDGHSTRTKYLHNPLRDIYYPLLRMAQYDVSREPSGTVEDRNKRPHLLINSDASSTSKIFLDVRTCDPCLKNVFPISSSEKGYAANLGVTAKNDAWLKYIQSQGDQFQALCHEYPGLIHDGALSLINKAATRCSKTRSQAEAFKTYWLQRLHITNIKGTADIMIHKMPLSNETLLPNTHTDPVPPSTTTLPLSCPVPHPIAPILPLPIVTPDYFNPGQPITSPFSSLPFLPFFLSETNQQST
jgi:hypothetical protein